MNKLNDNVSIGGFTLSIDGKQFAVVGFQLSKSVGAFSSCTVSISDYTQQVSFNSSSYPKKLGSIKEVFNKTQDYQNIGTLLDVQLKEYKHNGGTKIWFIGKLCSAAPALQTSFGVSASLSCFCLGKACLLMYSPAADFVYVPATAANNIIQLQSAGVFSRSISQAAYAASQKGDLITLLMRSGASSKDTILNMLDKCLAKLMQMKNKRGSILGQQPKIKLSEYFDCDIKLSDIAVKQLSQTNHPYVNSLIQDFFNGYNSVTLYEAVAQTIMARDRYLTFVPPSIQEAQSGYDKLKIWPSYVQPLSSDVVLEQDQMLSCNINSNPLQHLRTPTCLYIRAKKMTAFQATDNKTPEYWMSKGKYILQGAKPPYRLQTLDVPEWVLNCIVQSVQNQQIKESKQQAKDNKKNGANGAQLKNANDPQDLKEEQKGAKQTSGSQASFQPLLDQMAKTKFFHTYMMNKQANLQLAVTQNTLLFDSNVGKSVEFRMPVQAAQLGKAGLRFYGRVQEVRYTFKASSSPRNKSSLQISCALSGVTSADTPASIVYKNDGQLPIYKRG